MQMEYPVANGLLTSDFYLINHDMIIDIHGPPHYANLTMKPIDSALYISRIIKRYHKHYVIIDYTQFNAFLTQGEK